MQVRYIERGLKKDDKQICNFCYDKAVTSLTFFIEDYTWVLYKCNRLGCRNDTVVFDRPTDCIRCQLQTLDLLCVICKAELQGKNPTGLDHNTFMNQLIILFSSQSVQNKAFQERGNGKGHRTAKQRPLKSWLDAIN